jgi:hypothetical protein
LYHSILQIEAQVPRLTPGKKHPYEKGDQK